MTRPIRCLTLALCITLGVHSQLQAQALPITPAPSAGVIVTETSFSPGHTSSILDFSLLNWRMGQLSPYAQPTLTGSTTSSAQPAGNTVPVINPFIGSTIGMHGSLTSTSSGSLSQTGSSSPAVTSVVPASGSPSIASVYFAPRFVSFADLTPDYGLSPTLTNTSSETTLILTDLTGTTTTKTEQLFSVPEPGTLVLCGGLLVLAGYGWSRRRTTVQLPVAEAHSILVGETNESMST